MVSATAASVHEVGGCFDVVVANISAAVLIDMAHHIGGLVAAEGVLVLAGMLEEQASAVVAAYRSFKPVTLAVEDGWAAPILRAT